jgi:hypothetical protein
VDNLISYPWLVEKTLPIRLAPKTTAYRVVFSGSVLENATASGLGCKPDRHGKNIVCLGKFILKENAVYCTKVLLALKVQDRTATFMAVRC